MTFAYRYRKQLILGSLCLLLLICLFLFFFQTHLKEKSKTKEKTLVLTNQKKVAEKEETKPDKEIYYQVDIKGEIHSPGIYTVKANSRVIDVIRLAGDITSEADTSVLNLSKKVQDEMVIIVYSKKEVSDFTKTKEKETLEQKKCRQASDEALHNDACIGEDESVLIAGKVALNTATKEQLMTLNGIGEAKALDIISYRETHGPFQSIEEIKNVNGIGDALFAKIKENITL